MWKAALAGAVALATIGSPLVLAASEAAAQQFAAAGQQAVVTPAQVARLKTELKLTAEQEPLWPAVERAFHDLAQPQLAKATQGVTRGLQSRASAIVLDAAALHRLFTAAYPLLHTLNADQKQSAIAFARSVGLEAIAAAF